MINLLSNLDNTVILVISALCGTLFAYYQKWAWSDVKVGIAKYLFGDGKAVARSVTKLVGAISVALVTDMHSGMDLTAILALGVGIGLAVPESVKEEEESRAAKNNAKQPNIQKEN